MGTRGCVAVGTPEKWEGCYNHFDSYPCGLGAAVWAEWKENPNLPNDLLKFDDWRSYLNNGICEYCGKKRGQPHSITINIRTQSPGKDPDALFHRHNEGSPSEHHITSDNPDPLFIEWVYVLNPENKEMYVLSQYGQTYVHVRTIKLDEPEPNWNELQNEIREEFYFRSNSVT